MKIIRKSSLSGKIRAMEIDITPVQLAHWDMGELLTDIAPHLTHEECWFINDGVVVSELETMVGAKLQPPVQACA